MEVVERDLAAKPLPPITRDYARAVTSRHPDTSAFDISEQLVREIETTDALIINTPMHNFTVPAALKLWIDYVLAHSSHVRGDARRQGRPDARPAGVRDRRIGRLS